MTPSRVTLRLPDAPAGSQQQGSGVLNLAWRTEMTVRSSTRDAQTPTRPSREDTPPKPAPQEVPRVVRDATDRFVKKYSKTLRDLEKY